MNNSWTFIQNVGQLFRSGCQIFFSKPVDNYIDNVCHYAEHVVHFGGTVNIFFRTFYTRHCSVELLQFPKIRASVRQRDRASVYVNIFVSTNIFTQRNKILFFFEIVSLWNSGTRKYYLLYLHSIVLIFVTLVWQRFDRYPLRPSSVGLSVLLNVLSPMVAYERIFRGPSIEINTIRDLLMNTETNRTAQSQQG